MLSEKQLEMSFGEYVANILPHGAGIDYDWQITETKKTIICKNTFHYLNANGYYDGVLPFSLIIKKNDLADFRVVFHVNSAGRYRVNRSGLKDYLEQTFQWWIMDNGEDIKKFMKRGK